MMALVVYFSRVVCKNGFKNDKFWDCFGKLMSLLLRGSSAVAWTLASGAQIVMEMVDGEVNLEELKLVQKASLLERALITRLTEEFNSHVAPTLVIY